MFFYSKIVYSVSLVFLSFFYHPHFRFHPLHPLLLFHHSFLLWISYVCFFLFSFWTGVVFRHFRHNRNCNKLQVHFLSHFLSSNNTFLLLVFKTVVLDQKNRKNRPKKIYRLSRLRCFSYSSFSLICRSYFC